MTKIKLLKVSEKRFLKYAFYSGKTDLGTNYFNFNSVDMKAVSILYLNKDFAPYTYKFHLIFGISVISYDKNA